MQHPWAAQNPCRDRERGKWRACLPIGGAFSAIFRIAQVGAQNTEKNVRTASADPFTRARYSWRCRDCAGRVERVRWRHMRADGRWALAIGRSRRNPGEGKGLTGPAMHPTTGVDIGFCSKAKRSMSVSVFFCSAQRALCMRFCLAFATRIQRSASMEKTCA